jgi:1-deoxy-D-xylulose-5-phosphate synthase
MMILNHINSPAELRQQPLEALPKIAAAYRQMLLEKVNHTGGHLGASLGAVELTIALHYVFDTPTDKIIWDVGHQSYVHKMLTERMQQFETIRKKDGLAPFPRREESPYDAFGVGHSSTSISAALGMSLANRLKGNNHKAIAVIGDGAMTAGMAFEAMNHAGDLQADLLIILNDNVGALSHYFAHILSSKHFSTLRDEGKKILSRIPPVWEFARKTEAKIKKMVVPGSFFEELGLDYMGPVDGHDVCALVQIFQRLKNLKGPKIIHTITQKGKGYPPAEQDPIKYHGVSKGFYTPKKIENAEISISKAPSMPSYSEVFGDWLCEVAEADPRVVGITPAMREGSGMVRYAKEYPARYFDVGIAEQHSVTLAAGLACENMKPVVAIYSTFLQRAYDQLIHDVCIQNLPVLFAIDRAGLVNDGPTHCGSFDHSYLRAIPNMIVMAPSDANECRQMLYTGLYADSPAAVRYPRGQGPIAPLHEKLTSLPRRQRNRIIMFWQYGCTCKNSGRKIRCHADRYAFCQTLR